MKVTGSKCWDSWSESWWQKGLEPNWKTSQGDVIWMYMDVWTGSSSTLKTKAWQTNCKQINPDQVCESLLKVPWCTNQLWSHSPKYGQHQVARTNRGRASFKELAGLCNPCSFCNLDDGLWENIIESRMKIGEFEANHRQNSLRKRYLCVPCFGSNNRSFKQNWSLNVVALDAGNKQLHFRLLNTRMYDYHHRIIVYHSIS